MNKNNDPFRNHCDELVSQFKVFHSNISVLENGEIDDLETKKLESHSSSDLIQEKAH